MPSNLFKALLKLNCILEHWRTQITFVILQEPPVLQDLDVFYRVVYVIGAVKCNPWEVGMACENVQYRGEEAAAKMAMCDAD